MAFGDNGLIKQAELARDLTANSTGYETQATLNLVSYMNEMLKDSGIIAPVTNEIGGSEEPEEPDVPPTPEEPATDGTFNIEKGVNTPNLGADMQLVVFDSSTNTWKEDTTKEAYSYKDTSKEGANSSEWANAKVTTQVNGQLVESYFVWIPRYAYKIIGTNNIDIKFIKGTGKETVDGTPCKYASENPTANDYIVHPAFTDEEENGGWDKQLPGIWIGKYEASSVEGNSNNAADNVTTKHVQVKPGVSSWRYIEIGNMYEVSKAYAPNLESHMLKNSEWGAVAYLTESKYGRNGQKVTINNNGTTYYTGGGADNAYITSTPQSSTGNVYGIYDLVGNAYEYVATSFGGQGAIETSNGSNKYGTVYDGTTETVNFKKGDATRETQEWHGDGGHYVVTGGPFLYRGGERSDGTEAGIFYFAFSSGIGRNVSFRLALCR